MRVSQAKENILKKIRKALSDSTPIPFPQSEGNSPVFTPNEEDLDVLFAKRFTKLQGRFAFCSDTHDLTQQLTALVKSMAWNRLYIPTGDKILDSLLDSAALQSLNTDDLAGCDASITLCESLVARTGSIVLSAAQAGGRLTSVYAPIHICIAFSNQVVYDVKDALQRIKEKYPHKLPSLISFATGPSRTADIEKTLVVGVHGPKEVFVFLVDS